MAAYQYSPLINAHEIRLLWLDHGRPADRLSGELLHVDVENCPDYEALSYTWGEPRLACSLYCNNVARLPITENLFKALRQLRYVDRPRLVWVDAVSIDQNDVIERSVQVKLMSKIYAGAQQVVIWLGEDTFNASLAFSELKDLTKRLPIVTWHAGLRDSAQGMAIINLFQQSWFTRTWVIQEVVLARKATVVCGNCMMDWNQFLDVAKAFYESGTFYHFAMPSRVHDSLCQLSELTNPSSSGSPKSRTLIKLLYAHRPSEASDFRDKLLALIGIASDGDKWSYICDYTKSVRDIYLEFASSEICKYGNPDLLAQCSFPDNTETHLELPSWVPDWSRHLPTNASLMIADGYRSAGNTVFKGRLGHEQGTLLIDGAFLGTVERMGRSAVEENLHNMTAKDKLLGLQLRCERLDEYFQIAAMSKTLGNASNPAFARAIVANRDNKGKRLNISDTDLSALYAKYRMLVGKLMELPNLEEIEEADLSRFKWHASSPLPAEAWIEEALDNATFGRRFCLFSDGTIGYVSEKAELGDRIAFFLGATIPILLRPFGDSYLVVGESYVHGMMEGQVFANPDAAVRTIMLR